jgi:hypothetical protein
MRSKLQRLGVAVCPAVVCAAAVLMAAAILLLPLGAHRFAHWAGAHLQVCVFPASQRTGVAADKAEAGVRARAVESYGKLPLSFEVNKGQTDSRVKFLSRGSGYSLFLTGNEAVLSLRKPVQRANGKRQMAKGVAQGSHSNPAVLPGLFAGPGAHENEAAFPAYFRTPTAKFTDSAPATDCRGKDLEKPQGLKGEPCATQTTDALLRMKLVGASPNPKIVGMDELPGKSNYFIGNDPKKWRTNVPNYAKVRYASVYPGVDLVYYGNQGQLEYDFVVSPGADPEAITLQLKTGQSKIQNLAKIQNRQEWRLGGEHRRRRSHLPQTSRLPTDNVQRTTNDERRRPRLG